MREIYERSLDTLERDRLPAGQLSFQVVAPFSSKSVFSGLALICLFVLATTLSLLAARLLGLWCVLLLGLYLLSFPVPSIGSLPGMIATFIAMVIVVIVLAIATETVTDFTSVTARVKAFATTFAIVVGLAAAIRAYVIGIRSEIVLTIAAAALLGPPLIHVVADRRIDSTGAFLFFLIPAIVLTSFLFDRIVALRLHYDAADPAASKRSELQRLSLFQTRLSHQGYAQAFYMIAFLVVAGFALVCFLPQGFQFTPLATTLALLAFLFLSLTAALLQLLAQRDMSFLAAAKHFVQALSLWWSYDIEKTPGIVIPPPPWTQVAVRRSIFLLALCFLTAAIVLSASFFPLSLINERPWFALANTPGILAAEPRFPTQESILVKINEAPASWTSIAGAGLHAGRPFFAWTFLLAGLLSVLTPVLVFFALGTVIFAPIVPLLRTQSADPRAKPPWETVVCRIQASSNPVERESIFLGYDVSTNFPVLVPRTMLEEHMHILGDSGSGKTALGLMPIMTQLVRLAGLPQGDVSFPSSVVLIDLKGDRALFHSARLEAHRAGIPFRWFTIESNRSTYGFNPFLQSHVPKLTTTQVTESITEALSLAHGEGYGRGYFTSINQEVLNAILDAHPTRITSFRELYEYSTDKKIDLLGKKLGFTKQKQQDAGELFAAIRKLASIKPLNSGDGHPQIDLADVLRCPQVVYFYLPAGLSATSVRQIGKLALRSILGAAVTRRRELDESLNSATTADKLHRAYILVDEFQQVVSENLGIFVSQARSMKLSMILANQTISDLKTATVDLIPTVSANTRVKQFFSATDLEQQTKIKDASGETVDYVMSWSKKTTDKTLREPGLVASGVSSQEITESEQQTILPRLSKNDIIEASDRPDLSIVHIPRGSGYAQFAGYPFILRSQFHITLEEYLRRESLPWPRHPIANQVPDNQATTEAPPVQVSSSVPVFDDIVRKQQEEAERQRQRAKRKVTP